MEGVNGKQRETQMWATINEIYVSERKKKRVAEAFLLMPLNSLLHLLYFSSLSLLLKDALSPSPMLSFVFGLLM